MEITDAKQTGPSSAWFRRFVLADEFLAILEETDENDHGRPCKTDKKT